MPQFKNLLRAAKQRCLPPSSRSFHHRMDTIRKETKVIQASMSRLTHQLTAMTGHIEAVEAMQRAQIELIQEQQKLIERQARVIEARTSHNRFFLEELYRREGEEPRQTMARLFSSLPPAEGVMRLSQLATAKLLYNLDCICRHLNIDYWLSWGALVATVYRQGAIPWDDDIDVSMLRPDAERLTAYLTKVNAAGADKNELGFGYQITVVYDCFVKVRQVRFSLIDEDVPCFIDIFVCDKAQNKQPDADQRVRKFYHQQGDELHTLRNPDGELAYWADYPYLRAAGSAACAQVFDYDWDSIDSKEELRCGEIIQAVMDRYHHVLEDEALILPREAMPDAESTYLVYGIDNLNEVEGRPFVWDASLFFPTRTMRFEGYEVRVPNCAVEVCDMNYLRKTPFLPTDIYSHNHYAGSVMRDERTIAGIRRYLEA